MSKRPGASVGIALRRASALGAVAVLLVLMVLPLADAAPAITAGATSYDLPRSAFNITDHNLSFETNEVALDAPVNGSWELDIADGLVANSSRSPSEVESEISFGPGPVPHDGDETTITPIFIVQQSAAGLLRIEYVPFPMNDTYGFIVYQGYPVSAGAEAFGGHTLSMVFESTAPPIAPYPLSVPYGQTNGNVSVLLGGRTLVSQFPVDWSSLTAFYAYGVTTSGFVSGAISANVTTLPTEYPHISPEGTGSLVPVPSWLVSAAIAAVVAAAVVAIVQRRGVPPG